MEDSNTDNIKFADLGLIEPLLRAVTDMGFEHPMPIQALVIPYLLQDSGDAVALAQTGTGKTAAFGLPLLQRIFSGQRTDGFLDRRTEEPEGDWEGERDAHQLSDRRAEGPKGLVIAPTRELCLQIASDLADLARYLPDLRILTVYGGSNIESQIRALKRGVQVLVATPGRLLDLIRRGVAKLDDVRTVVLDEADEMLNMGFIEDIEEILTHVPEQRRMLMFSATMPREIQRIAERFMHDPKEFVAGTRNQGAENVRHIYYMVKADDKYLALKRVADYNPNIYGIVFCRTRLQTQEVADKLIADGYNADCLHGDLSQAQRDLAMRKFRDHVTQLLVATDVAARGLDVDDLTHVIHYSLPDDTAVYTHRSGRTGRAGKAGISVAIIHSREQGRLRQIEKKIGKTFERKMVPTPHEIIERQLYTMADKLETAIPDNEGLDPYMSGLRKKLEWLSADELLMRVFSLELHRLLAYYRDMSAIDLDVKKDKKSKIKDQTSSIAKKKDRRSAEEGYTRIYLNAGKAQGIFPGALMELINSNLAPGKHKPDIGRIDLLEDYSLFDVKDRDAKTVIGALKHADFYGHRLYAEEAKEGKEYAPKAKTKTMTKTAEAKKPKSRSKSSSAQDELELWASLPPKQRKKLKRKGLVNLPEPNPYHGNYDKFINKKKKKI